MAFQELQSRLTKGVKGFYEATGPSGAGDRNSRMAAGGLLSPDALAIDNIRFLTPETAARVRIHHHFGLGTVDGDPETMSQAELTNALYRLENDQVSTLLQHMGTIRSTDNVLDAGSGRGGTAFEIHDRHGSTVYGISIASYQVLFSHLLTEASQREHVHFLPMNMLDIGFAGDTFDHIVQNETDMYIIDLPALYQGFSRVLKPGGRFTFATWCMNGKQADSPTYAAPIDTNYRCKMHSNLEYRPALEAAGFTDVVSTDLTKQAIPYWEIRNLWEDKSGVEDHYLRGYQDDRLRYLIVSAQKPT